MRESLRDRKTLVVMVLLPLFLYPLFFGISAVSMMQHQKLEESDVAGDRRGLPANVREALSEIPATRLAEVDDAVVAVADGKVNVAAFLEEQVTEVGDEGAFPSASCSTGKRCLQRVRSE